ncbi:Uncharacterised protein [Klebsiella pneumoniae]|nr:Uncharacterised protein [Klebsiella pneumoniae]
MGQAGGLQRLEVVVRRGQPVQADRRRQRIARHRLAVAQGVALALDDQGRRAQPGEVRDPRLLRLAGGVERVAEADQGIRAQLVGQQAGHAPAHRLAAQGQGPVQGLADLRMDSPPAVEQLRLRIRRTLAAVLAALGHVGKLEARDGDALGGEQFGDALHERAVHRRPGAMGENQGGRQRAGRAVPFQRQLATPRMQWGSGSQLIPINIS